MKIIRAFLPLVLFFVLLVTSMRHFSAATVAAVDEAVNVSAPLLVEYPIPTADSGPHSIIVESSGRTWFTAQNANSIGRLVVTDTNDYQFTMYTIATANSQPYDLAFDGGSYIWFTELAGNNIGRLDVNTGIITEYPIPTANSAPADIAIAPNGKIWFVERDGNKIGNYDPGSGTFYEKAYPESGALLESIDVASSGLVWFTAPGLSTPRIVQFNPGTEVFTSVLITHPGFSSFTPGDIMVDEIGLPWITTYDAGLIGRFAPGTLFSFLWYTVSPENAGQSALTQTISGTQRLTWFTEKDSGQVGVLTTKINATYLTHGRYLLPSANSQPTGIAVDDQGHAWIAEYGANKIAEWQPPYFTFTYLPVILNP